PTFIYVTKHLIKDKKQFLVEWLKGTTAPIKQPTDYQNEKIKRINLPVVHANYNKLKHTIIQIIPNPHKSS
ncbi:hypothetical protein ACQWHW_26280, partial [Salmonella enterica subsp. enterica serovar Infantis]